METQRILVIPVVTVYPLILFKELFQLLLMIYHVEQLKQRRRIYYLNIISKLIRIKEIHISITLEISKHLKTI